MLGMLVCQTAAGGLLQVRVQPGLHIETLPQLGAVTRRGWTDKSMSPHKNLYTDGRSTTQHILTTQGDSQEGYLEPQCPEWETEARHDWRSHTGCHGGVGTGEEPKGSQAKGGSHDMECSRRKTVWDATPECGALTLQGQT
ncbi:hypothetical protein LEMLEM_LOCUS25625 [Lemmus lemmus]